MSFLRLTELLFPAPGDLILVGVLGFGGVTLVRSGETIKEDFLVVMRTGSDTLFCGAWL